MSYCSKKKLVIKRMRELAADNKVTYFEWLDIAKELLLSPEDLGEADYEEFSYNSQFELLVSSTILLLEDEELNRLYVEWTGEVSPLAIECKLVS